MKQAADTQGRSDEVASTATTERGQADNAAAIPGKQHKRPTIEISDADYRSFCWPCLELDDSDDCKSRH